MGLSLVYLSEVTLPDQVDPASERTEQHFVEWWKDSYGIPPGRHAIMTHVAYALKFHADNLSQNAASSND